MLSVVVPCFNEEDGIQECYLRLVAVLELLPEPFELVFVNDGSRDSTYPQLLAIQQADSRVVLVELSRNFGHQKAVSAGLGVALGDGVVIIDADLQDPPEVIVKMYEIWKQGFEVIYGVRESRAGESLFKLCTAKIFYNLLNRLSDVDIPLDTGDFRLIDRRVVDVMVRMPERHRLLRAMCSWVGFKQVGVRYERAERFAGSTKYPLKKMVNLALDGILSFSTLPLRVLTIVGVFTAGLSLLASLYALYVRLFTHHWVQGWATLIIAILFLSGLQIVSVGVIGEYVGRIYTEAKQRPLYIVREVVRSTTRAASMKQGPLANIPVATEMLYQES
jgi:glycosyltransferase involved in cell wall biosynthesis